MKRGVVRKVVLAYSGGLDTSVIIRWLVENYGCEVIAYIADLGQGEDLSAAKRKALNTGASKVIVDDLKKEFVEDFVFPMLRTGALYEGQYLMGTSIARPLIAKGQIACTKKFKGDAVSHGSTGKGNDQVRFELTYHALMPGVRIVAPWREWEFKSRNDLVEYAKKWRIPVPVTKAKPYSSDRNLLHISFEGGILEDPWKEPPFTMKEMTRYPEEAPSKPEYVTIGFKNGDPVSINERRYSGVALLGKLNKIGWRHGVGRVDMVENRFVGMKSRGVYETPGGTIIHKAHQAVESLTLDREVQHLSEGLRQRYAELVYYGFWFAPEREVLQAFFDKTQERVTGEARLKLYKGGVHVVGRRSPYSLFKKDLATFEEDSVYKQAEAEGFINLNALRLKLRGIKNSKH